MDGDEMKEFLGIVLSGISFVCAGVLFAALMPNCVKVER